MLDLISRLRKHLFLYLSDQFFGFLVLIVALVPLVLSPGLTFSLYGTAKVAVFFAFIGAAAICLYKKTSFRVNWTLTALLVLLILSGIVSTIFSWDVSNSIFGITFRWVGLLFFILLAIFMVFLSGSLNGSRALFLAKALVLSGVINAVQALFQTFGIGYYEGPHVTDTIYRPIGLLGNANFLAMFLLSVIPFSISLFMESKSLSGKLYYFISCFLMIWAMMFTQSRGAIFGLILSLLIYVAFLISNKTEPSKKKYLILIPLTVFTLLFVTFGYIIRPTAYTDAFTQSDENSLTRLVAWNIALEGIEQHPLTGVGLGNYVLLYKDKAEVFLGGIFDDAHNLYLHLGSTGGLLFLGFFLAINCLALVRLYRKLFREQEYYWLYLSGFSALVGLLLSFSFNPVELASWTVWAFLITLAFFDKTTELRLIPVIKKISLGFGIFLVLYSIYFIASESFAYHGGNAYYNDDYIRSRKLLSNSLPINPMRYYNDFYRLKTEIALASNPSELQNLNSQIEEFGRSHGRSSAISIGRGMLYFSLYEKDARDEYFEQAMLNMRDALKKDPYFSGVRNRMIHFYFKKGDLETAEKIAKEQIVTVKHDLLSWLWLANIYNSTGREEELDAALLGARNYAALQPAQNAYVKRLMVQKNNPKTRKDFDSALSESVKFDLFSNYPF